MREPMVTEFVGRDNFGLQQCIQGRCIVPKLSVASGNINQKPGAAFGELARHPINVHCWDMLHRFGCIAQFNSNDNMMDRHIGGAKHSAKVRPLFV